VSLTGVEKRLSGARVAAATDVNLVYGLRP
jgi:hypothetical protein